MGVMGILRQLDLFFFASYTTAIRIVFAVVKSEQPLILGNGTISNKVCYLPAGRNAEVSR